MKRCIGIALLILTLTGCGGDGGDLSPWSGPAEC